jgi:hypothetical protein
MMDAKALAVMLAGPMTVSVIEEVLGYEKVLKRYVSTLQKMMGFHEYHDYGPRNYTGFVVYHRDVKFILRFGKVAPNAVLVYGFPSYDFRERVLPGYEKVSTPYTNNGVYNLICAFQVFFVEDQMYICDLPLSLESSRRRPVKPELEYIEKVQVPAQGRHLSLLKS